MAPPSPPPPSLQDYRDEVESTALPRSDAIETHCGVIRPENLIWDPPNLKELGPMKLLGVYNLPPAFWPASLKDRVKNLGIDVDGTNRADDSSNIKNPSSFVPYDTTDLLENSNFSTPSHHANEDIFDIVGLSVDEYYGQTEIAAITEQGEDKYELSLSPGVMEAAATDSEELLSYFTGSRKRKRAIYSGNEFSPAAAERFEMHDDFELFEPPHSKPRLDSCETVEDVLSLCHYIYSDESTDFYD
ncbi:uncharacterized protein LOC130087611 [Rhinichthys klamathensis goyatoka]|uniref:uncharacterized protein LOC130087611 n=1 Tax=Rhinichthys klamathensis goyatoka TaxID=3034132 RepID=UPI0024B5A67C|nr:uncharacterized protein LOC130087611 [Rhinichthys klamathensis goyatoka]